MKDAVPNYVPDMNHDGDIDRHDAALFHSMLDEDQKNERHTRPSTGNNEPRTIYHSIAKGILLVIFGGFIALLFNGVFPVNGVTSVMALVSAVCFLRTLLL